ncbi:GDP/UDP-N,N'-diacetylbacillosamine 2-epimerase (hydrolysing) [Caldanaerobius fijiensis DSM 17918]|uniref:GDP/UDP-N,N'-diacetylbacillosamine 2-epimerase (Hydrolysing) n=1 Tax=Caldanaerobius fijiensis DSM 17918 TaxID=1121256 RepID=A0A1M4V2K4_9THEO|nr:UDP-N-acetylglucosamine 2-epimerase [Caldanaerobius fijiensis]SHE63175.1 GDP/UDP-N,N'-diacetylbacillosamine 2-epimerase (hydrolysing) [Caldanaerobius fijiensis DSM 17918]
MRKIAVVTGTRAEYGLLYWTLKEIANDPELELQLIVTGSHLSPEFGLTKRDIEKDGFKIYDEVEILLSSDTGQGIAKSIGLGIISFAQVFSRLKPHILLILGDRFEVFAAATAAMALNIPIAHIAGGESTEGAIDEQIRHAITKMAHIHFPSCDYYAERIIKMGEEEWRVYNVGAPGLENIKKLKLLDKGELEKSLGIRLDLTTLLVTYHPETLERENIEQHVNNLLEALKETGCQIIFTYPNADSGGRYIIGKINDFVEKYKKARLYINLGQIRYLSLLKYVDVMVGNSSSGIIEAPSFKLPVVNIGSRQKGRLRALNIIDVGYSKEEILSGIRKALYDESFRRELKNTKNLYGEGDTSKKIVSVLKTVDINNENFLMKKLTY